VIVPERARAQKAPPAPAKKVVKKAPPPKPAGKAKPKAKR
jgi:hypothetical protein